MIFPRPLDPHTPHPHTPHTTHAPIHPTPPPMFWTPRENGNCSFRYEPLPSLTSNRDPFSAPTPTRRLQNAPAQTHRSARWRKRGYKYHKSIHSPSSQVRWALLCFDLFGLPLLCPVLLLGVYIYIYIYSQIRITKKNNKET